jgi:hypothetical protein
MASLSALPRREQRQFVAPFRPLTGATWIDAGCGFQMLMTGAADVCMRTAQWTMASLAPPLGIPRMSLDSRPASTTR